MSENVEHELPSQGNPAAAALEPTTKTDKDAVAVGAGVAAETSSGYGAEAATSGTASDRAQDQEVEALQSLYRQAVHLPEPEPEYQPDGPITRMTHHQLQAMRSRTAVETEIKVPFKETVANFVIRSFDELKQTFKRSSAPRRRKCLDVGHECIHCGKQFAVEAKKDADKGK